MSNLKLSRTTKERKGSYQACRDKPTITARQALQEPAPPPDTLSAGARKEWLALMPVSVELQTITRADLRAFEQLCEVLNTVSQLQALVKAEGHLIDAANGGKKANPAVRSLETARNQALRLLEQFGLTPKSRNYIEKAEVPHKDSVRRRTR